MKTITFPSGEDVPALGQGTWFIGDKAPAKSDEIAALRTGLDLGLAVVDTAEMYGSGRSERLVGEALEGCRDQAFLVSKVLPHNAGRSAAIKACEGSLKRLRTDCIDLYLLHWRGGVPFSETVEAFEQLRRDGKIRHWGVSNLDPADMEELAQVPGGKSVETDQVLYNLTRRGPEWDLIPWCRKKAIPIMAYSPIEQARLLKNKALCALAGDLGVTAAQLALAWVMRNPGVLAIPKAGTVAHVKENVRAAELELSDETLAALDRLFPPPDRPQPLEIL